MCRVNIDAHSVVGKKQVISNIILTQSNIFDKSQIVGSCAQSNLIVSENIVNNVLYSLVRQGMITRLQTRYVVTR